MPRTLLINPWIHDFSAFDLWAYPLGLLNLAAIIRAGGWNVDYIDCTSRVHPLAKAPPAKPFHTGKYPCQEIPKPPAVAGLPRRFKRYGIPPEIVLATMQQLPVPDAILVTSRMTYWYTGVCETIELCRRVFPAVPVILGGTYASLCPDHARRVCRPDVLVQGEGENRLSDVLHATTGMGLDTAPAGGWTLDNMPAPAYDLLAGRGAAPVETSRGCPWHCTYCATRSLFPQFRQRSVARTIDIVEEAVGRHGIEDLAFYDDALLADAETRFLVMAEEWGRRGAKARFHTPNGLSAAQITPEVARSMKRMGFETVRVSLESANVERLRSWGRRPMPEDFVAAMANLRAAGFQRSQLGVYIMCAMPGQSAEEVRQTIDLAARCGGTPRLCEYSPIPGTAEWRKTFESTTLPIDEEPLLHNNTVFHWASGKLGEHAMSQLKRYAQERCMLKMRG